MRFTNYLGYAIRDAFRALHRHKGMAIVTMITISITILILGFIGLFALNSQAATEKVENKLEMIVFVEKGASGSQLNNISKELKNLPEVDSVEFISKEVGLKKISSKFESDSDLKVSLEGDNPLPDAFKVKLKKVELSDTAVNKIEKIKYVQEVKYGKDVVKDIVKFNQSLKFIVVIIIILMIIATMFLINSTISLTVSNRNEEIKIMSFIGASLPYIRAPFFLEGILIGLVGSIIAVVILSISYKKIGIYVIQNLPFIPYYNNNDVMIMLFSGLIFCGIVLGALGSALAVRKYFKS